jgi:hypothetical protein
MFAALPSHIGILATPQWLTWAPEHRDNMMALYDAYHATVCRYLGHVLATFRRADHQEGLRAERALCELEDIQFSWIVRAPSTAQAVFCRPHDLDWCAAHLLRSVAAERVRSGAPPTANEENWSASGDLAVYLGRGFKGVLPENQTGYYTTAGIFTDCPLDFRSPHALGIHVSGNYPQLSYEASSDRVAAGNTDFYSTDEETELASVLRDVLARIDVVSPHVGWMTRTFTLSLVVRRNCREPWLVSGSDGQFTGRTTLVNPLGVSKSVLADALVHEAIHSILYMQERMEPWVNNEDVFFGEGYSAVSPWSGRTLTPRQFMQACFVWRGLYAFWMTATSDIFDDVDVMRQRAQARKGFYANALCEQLASWEQFTFVNVKRAIESTQRSVLLSDFPILAS